MLRCSTRFRVCPLHVAGMVFALGLLVIVSCQSDNGESSDTASDGVAAPTDTVTEDPSTETETAAETPDDVAAEPELGPSGHFTEVQVADNGTKHLIPLDQVFAGGPAKDGIPSIDNPQFVGPDEWEALDYKGDGLVIGVEVSGQRRAYPFQVLVWHEIVNDTLSGKPLLISYCPLCGTGIVFEPLIEAEAVEFGVSGQLYNSDLLMYDRLTDTLWSQITGTAVVGELTGQRLELYPSEIMTWADWQATYPDSEVLSRETGHSRNYDADPYGDYYTDGSIMFPVSEQDERLSLKARVTGVEVDEETFGAYPDRAVREHGPINDVLGDLPLLVVADPGAGNTIVIFERQLDDGQVLTFDAGQDGLIDRETGTRWNYRGAAVEGKLAGSQLVEISPIKGFWFAWFAFHPETALWQPE